jgi:hypothetical protein
MLLLQPWPRQRSSPSKDDRWARREAVRTEQASLGPRCAGALASLSVQMRFFFCHGAAQDTSSPTKAHFESDGPFEVQALTHSLAQDFADAAPRPERKWLLAFAAGGGHLDCRAAIAPSGALSDSHLSSIQATSSSARITRSIPYCRALVACHFFLVPEYHAAALPSHSSPQRPSCNYALLNRPPCPHRSCHAARSRTRRSSRTDARPATCTVCLRS